MSFLSLLEKVVTQFEKKKEMERKIFFQKIYIFPAFHCQLSKNGHLIISLIPKK
jgi:hypothetical protein